MWNFSWNNDLGSSSQVVGEDNSRTGGTIPGKARRARADAGERSTDQEQTDQGTHRPPDVVRQTSVTQEIFLFFLNELLYSTFQSLITINCERELRKLLILLFAARPDQLSW